MGERRRHARRQAKEFLVVCDHQTGVFIGQVADMTANGAMLLSDKPTPPDTTVHCQMTLPDKTHGDDQINFEAESRWCRFDDETGMYQTGYEFRNMTPDNMEVIKSLVKFWSVSRPKKVQI